MQKEQKIDTHNTVTPPKNNEGQPCGRCKEFKPFSEFGKDNRSKTGYRSTCNQCRREYREKNKTEINRRKREAYASNSNLREACSMRMKKYREENTEKVRASKKSYREKNKDKINEDLKRRYYENREDRLAKNKEYREKNKEKLQKKANDRKSERLKTDHVFHTKCRVSSLIRISLHRGGFPKNSDTEMIIGVTFEKFVEYIESQFVDGMNWDNRYEWHLDHIIPVSFAETEEQIYKLNNYKNLRPLWGTDNIVRSNKVEIDCDIDKYTIEELVSMVLEKETLH
jgi:hypothetical protein